MTSNIIAQGNELKFKSILIILNCEGLYLVNRIRRVVSAALAAIE